MIFIKKILKKILRIFKIEISIYKPTKHSIDSEYFIPLKENDDDYQLYKLGLSKSQNEQSDNIYKQMRFLSLIQLLRIVINKKDVKSFAECGCWRGHSSFIISSIIKESSKNIKFHIFDSFEGLSISTPRDSDFYKRNDEDKESISRHFNSSELFVKDNVLKNFNFVKTYKGWIPDRVKEVEKESFSFVHIDVDLYEPTKESLEFFYPKLDIGGIIVCDDYNISAYPGAKDAWDEYFSKQDYSFFYKTPLGACYIVK